MLASLLPGLRQLRTPLATGYLYALSLYLLLRDSIPTTAKDEGHLKPLYDVMPWLGKLAALAVGAFLAYLMGSVLEVRAATLSRWFRIVITLSRRPLPDPWDEADEGRFRWGSIDTGELTKPAAKKLTKYSWDRLSRRVHPTRRSPGTADKAMHQLVEDLPQLSTRLYTANKDMYGDYDRLTAEADLKVNVGLAGIFLSCVMTAQVHWLWVLLWIPMALLGLRGLSTLRRANDLLVQAIVTDLVKSLAFEEFIDDLGPSTGDPDSSDPGYR
ncbi:hypothetical protein [Streptomyces sp. R35]|uniref:ABC transmembrane type-1 domain-containing protein n=1 Tax=Streptomyces sp. R35 TaxID=3238630 RepID=A0AB39RVK0_9ACTN